MRNFLIQRENLLTLRKNSSQEQQEDTSGKPPDIPEEDFSLHQPMAIHFPPSFADKKWDHKWLQLVGACFTQFQWPPEDSAPSEVSCIELMLDRMIHYQVTMPVNTPFLRRVGGSSSMTWDKTTRSIICLPVKQLWLCLHPSLRSFHTPGSLPLSTLGHTSS